MLCRIYNHCISGLFDHLFVRKKMYCSRNTSQCPKTILSFKYIHVYTDSCVIFIKTKTSWQDARNFCKSLGGDLITIKDARKQLFIMQYLAVNHWETNEVWIGLTDQVKEGDWRWIDGSKLSFNCFAKEQGNNHAVGFLFTNGGNEDCALIRRDDGGQWHDYHCAPLVGSLGYQFSFACEFKISTTPPDSASFHQSTMTLQQMSISKTADRPCEDNTLVNCSDPAVCSPVFRKNCPLTCGLCVAPTKPTESTTKLCEDDTFLNCKDPGICNSASKNNCPVACGLCTPCVDNHFVNCLNGGVCSSSYKQHCRKSCGLCGPQ